MRLVQDLDHLRDAGRLHAAAQLALLDLVQLPAVGDHHGQLPGCVRRNLDRDGRDLLGAAIVARQDLERHRPSGARAHLVEPHPLDRRRPRFLGGRDGKLDPFHRDRFDVVREQQGDRARDIRRRRRDGAVAGEDVLVGQVGVLVERRLALDGEGHRAELTLVVAECVEQRDVGQQRREELIVHGGIPERPRRGAAAIERDGDGNDRRTLVERAGDRRRAILPHRPDHFPHRRDLERGHQAGQRGVDVGAGHREGGGAEVEKRMTEGVDAVAVDVRDRAGGTHLAIAAQERDADRIAGTQWPAVGSGVAAGSAEHRREACLTEHGCDEIRCARVHAAQHQRCRDWP